MSYKPRVWKSKEAITAPKLNNLEEAVANLYKKMEQTNGENVMYIANIEIKPNSSVSKTNIPGATEILVGDLICDTTNSIYRIEKVSEDNVNVGDKIPYLDSDNLSDMELTAITDSSGNLKGLSGTYKTNDNNIRKISFKITQE